MTQWRRKERPHERTRDFSVGFGSLLNQQIAVALADEADEEAKENLQAKKHDRTRNSFRLG